MVGWHRAVVYLAQYFVPDRHPHALLFSGFFPFAVLDNQIAGVPGKAVVAEFPDGPFPDFDQGGGSAEMILCVSGAVLACPLRKQHSQPSVFGVLACIAGPQKMAARGARRCRNRKNISGWLLTSSKIRV
jgi:hypothetical protein